MNKGFHFLATEHETRCVHTFVVNKVTNLPALREFTTRFYASLLRLQSDHPEQMLVSKDLNKSVLTKLEPMTIVSFELRDKPKFAIHVESVMQPEGSTQLTHTQMPL